MRLEKQGAEGFESNANILLANVGDDECTTVDNYVHFEKPPMEVGFLTKPTHEVQIRVYLTKAVLHPTMCLVETWEGLNLIEEDYLKPQWKCWASRFEPRKLWTATKEVINTQCETLLIVEMGEFPVRVWTKSSKKPTMTVILRTTYIDKFTRGTFFMDCKIVPEQSTQLLYWELVLKVKRHHYFRMKCL